MGQDGGAGAIQRATVHAVELRLGRHRFDLATQVLVMAVVDVADTERSSASAVDVVLAQQPAIVELVGDEAASIAAATRRLRERFDGPISIRTSAAAVLDAGLGAGACIGHDPSGVVDPSYLTVLAGHGASVVVCVAPDATKPHPLLVERAAFAESAGLDRSKIVLKLVAVTQPTYEQRHATMFEAADGAAGWGTAAVAVMSGCRIVATTELDGVRSLRRTVDSISELLNRRSAAGCDAADAIGFGPCP